MTTRTRAELMADMIVKADWLIMSPKTDHYGNYSIEYKTVFDEYTRLRAELAEVKERSADRLNEIICNLESEVDESIGREDEDYEKSWPYQTGILLCRKEVNEIIQYLHQFASQSPKMPTEEEINDAERKFYEEERPKSKPGTTNWMHGLNWLKSKMK